MLINPEISRNRYREKMFASIVTGCVDRDHNVVHIPIEEAMKKTRAKLKARREQMLMNSSRRRADRVRAACERRVEMKRWALVSLSALLGLATQASAQPNVTSPVSCTPTNNAWVRRFLTDLAFRRRDRPGSPLGANYFGKRPIILAIVQYRCRMLCTEVLNGLVEALRAMPDEPGVAFEVLTISFRLAGEPDLAAEKKANYLGAIRSAPSRERAGTSSPERKKPSPD